MKRIATVLATAGALGLAASPAALAAPNVGVAAAVNQDATGRPPGGGVRSLSLGDNVIHNERIVTSGSGLVQILLVDGSSFTVGAGSDVVIDEFVYDPNAGSGKLAISFTKGAMRFVGGRISKGAGAVTVNTGIGTIGIRGGIANLSIDPGCAGAGCDKGLLSLIFGDELTYAGNDGRQNRVFQAGYTMQISGQGSPRVRPTTAADLAPVQNQLASRPGQSGGASKPPSNQTVENSPLTQQNSGQTPTPTAPQTTVVHLGAQGASNDPTQDVGSDAGSDIVRGDVEEHVTPPPLPPELLALRALTVPHPFITPEDGEIPRPGKYGIAGGSAPTNQVTEFEVGEEGLSGSVNGFGPLVLPLPSGSHSWGYVGSIETEDGTAEVYSFENPGSFIYYWIHETDHYDNFAHIFGGTPTNWATVNEGASPVLRSYDLLTDPHQEIRNETSSGVPFLNQDIVNALGDRLEHAASPGVLIVDTQESGVRKLLTGGLLIDGMGVNQVSAVTISADTIGVDGDYGPDYSSARRGGARPDAYGISLTARGALATVRGPAGNHFFGSDVDNFVLGSDFANSGNPDNTFYDSGALPPERSYSQTIQIAGLDSTTGLGELHRTTRNLSGYAAGMVEPRRHDGSEDLTPVRSAVSTDARMSFDAAQSSVGAAFRVYDVNDLNPVFAAMKVVMGAGTGQPGHGRSAFVDDDRYGGTYFGGKDPETGAYPSDRTVLDNGTEINPNPNTPGSYFFSGDLMKQTSFVPSDVTLCTCEFLEWGWWGNRVQDDVTGGSSNRSDYLHLGTWVQGDVVRADELPTTGTASYSGHAVGNVARQTGAGTAQYVAAGNFDMSWNFGTRQGQMTISEFDGMTFQGAMAGTSPSADPNLFGGTLAGQGANAATTGTASGSFVRGPASLAQGAIGSFDLHGGGVRAAGTFMGERPPGL